MGKMVYDVMQWWTTIIKSFFLQLPNHSGKIKINVLVGQLSQMGIVVIITVW